MDRHSSRSPAARAQTQSMVAEKMLTTRKRLPCPVRWLKYWCALTAFAFTAALFLVTRPWHYNIHHTAELLATHSRQQIPRVRGFPGCFATEFQTAARHPPLEYVSTSLSRAHANQSKFVPNKSIVRVVVSPRHSHRNRHSDQLPVAYIITPTYARITQKADLLRLCYTLMHVPRVHWIVVEDSEKKTATVTEILANCPGPSVTHLTAHETRKTTHRGIAQRNAALDWIRRCVHAAPQSGGVYFADDDNTYDLLVFEAVRWTQKVSIWPVGIVGGSLWEGPICSNDKVIGFEGAWGQKRVFPVDMASFSLGLEFLLMKPEVKFQYSWSSGTLESRFLESLELPVEKFTPEPDANCSQVLAWHTRTVRIRSLKVPRAKPQPKGHNSTWHHNLQPQRYEVSGVEVGKEYSHVACARAKVFLLGACA